MLNHIQHNAVGYLFGHCVLEFSLAHPPADSQRVCCSWLRTHAWYGCACAPWGPRCNSPTPQTSPHIGLRVEFHEMVPWILVWILLGSLTIVRAGDVFFAWESLFDELHHCTGQRMQLLQVLVCHCDSPRLSGPRQECFQTFDNAQGRVCAVEHLVFRLHLCEHSSHRKRQHHKHGFSLFALQLPVVRVPSVPNVFHLAEDSVECIFFPLCQSSCITNNSQLPVYDSPYTAPHRGVHAPKSVLAQLVVYPPDDSAHQVLVQPCTVSSSQFIARVRAQTLSCVHAYTTRTQRLSPSSTCIGSGVVC